MPFMPVMPGAPFGPMANNAPFALGPPGAYDPTQAHMDMNNRQPAGGPVIQDLTPRPEGGPGPRNRPDGASRGRGRGRAPADHARGTFDRPTFGEDSGEGARPPRKGENKTLVVEKIPTEHLSLDGVNTWFKRFGTVTNVAIDAKGSKALVSFATPNEAHAAWKSEDAVFNNRFVKVFWHRPMEGHGAIGTKMLAASAPLIANMSGKEQESPDPTGGPSSTAVKTEFATPKKKPGDAAALAAKQQVLERQIAEQKTLMSKYSTATSADEKKELMDRLRKLTEEMKNGSAPPASSSAEDRLKERLDKELELHAVKTEVSNGSDDTSSTTEDLKAKLAKLREEVRPQILFAESILTRCRLQVLESRSLAQRQVTTERVAFAATVGVAEALVATTVVVVPCRCVA